MNKGKSIEYRVMAKKEKIVIYKPSASWRCFLARTASLERHSQVWFTMGS